jgi:hypothetical protein
MEDEGTKRSVVLQSWAGCMLAGLTFLALGFVFAKPIAEFLHVFHMSSTYKMLGGE